MKLFVLSDTDLGIQCFYKWHFWLLLMSIIQNMKNTKLMNNWERFRLSDLPNIA